MKFQPIASWVAHAIDGFELTGSKSLQAETFAEHGIEGCGPRKSVRVSPFALPLDSGGYFFPASHKCRDKIMDKQQKEHE
jgi:hypothetical protein